MEISCTKASFSKQSVTIQKLISMETFQSETQTLCPQISRDLMTQIFSSLLKELRTLPLKTTLIQCLTETQSQSFDSNQTIKPTACPQAFTNKFTLETTLLLILQIWMSVRFQQWLLFYMFRISKESLILTSMRTNL